MSGHLGPTPFYSLETISQCIANQESILLLQNPLFLLDDYDEKIWQLSEFCTPMLIGVQHPSEHFLHLDTQFSKLLPVALNQHPSRLKSSSRQTDVQQLSVLKTRQLVNRLPRRPQRNFALPLANKLLQRNKKTLWEGIKDGSWAAKYILPEMRSQFQLKASEDSEGLLDLLAELQDAAWDNLFVTTYMDTNSAVLAYLIATRGFQLDRNFTEAVLRYVNILSELLDVYNNLCDLAALGRTDAFSDESSSVQALKQALFPDEEDDHGQGRAILKVFLWTAWQRAVMLYFYYIVGVQLISGYSNSWNSFFAIQGIRTLSDVYAEVYRGEHIPYLCNWAFELLHVNRSSLGLDFRKMLHRFGERFGDCQGRCIKGSTETCVGDQPSSCQRFTGAETKAQSAHGPNCGHQCHRILWDDTSYKQCPSPRTVKINTCSASLIYGHIVSHNLAISHVWSHGHGGRPESGINSCLNQLYSSLAHSLGCQTYWIDSACIPTDNPWRRDAIKDINKIFTNSKATVIIDQDLQSIDMSSPTIQDLETLLSTLLICDWNVRAWTMLEAIRGSESIYLLCQGNKLINLRSTLIKVHQEGSVDIAVLLGSAQHLIPQEDPNLSKEVEEASYLLSRRHASRLHDEVRIWDLLIGGSGREDPVTIWKSQDHVRTGFLMSSAERVEGHPGLSWAPCSPYIRPQTRTVALGGGEEQKYMIRFPSYDGMGSLPARISKNGCLHGKWQVMDMDSPRLDSYFDDCCRKMVSYENDDFNPDSESTEGGTFEHPDEAGAYQAMEELLSRGSQVRLLRPLSEDGVTPYTGGTERGGDFGLLVAICTSNDRGETWGWVNVHQWQESNDAYHWQVEEMLIC